jgi:hypothetical protein
MSVNGMGEDSPKITGNAIHFCPAQHAVFPNERRWRTSLHQGPERRIEKNMDVTLPLEQMTIAEKFRVMETLWSDLTNDEEQFKSPEWHDEIRRERVARVKQGKESCMDWKTAKRQLRNRVK